MSVTACTTRESIPVAMLQTDGRWMQRWSATSILSSQKLSYNLSSHATHTHAELAVRGIEPMTLRYYGESFTDWAIATLKPPGMRICKIVPLKLSNVSINNMFQVTTQDSSAKPFLFPWRYWSHLPPWRHTDPVWLCSSLPVHWH